MKRFHVHVTVKDLNQSIAFYSHLFGAEPAVKRPDYAKWMLEDPRINFAISSRGSEPGVNHLGFQADDPAELAELGARADRASGSAVLKETGVACCYAKGNKYWVIDPQGLAWEYFQTLGEVPIFGEDTTMKRPHGEACCVPLHNEKSTTAQDSNGTCCVPAVAAAIPSRTGACC